MKNYPVGATVNVTIPLTDLNGDPATPTGLSYVVQDGTGATVSGPTDVGLPAGGAASVAIAVPGAANAAVGARNVVLTITTATETFTKEAAYGVRAATRLIYIQNSFQSYAQAQFVAQDIPNLTFWGSADDEARQVAMIAAFERLKTQTYLIPYPELQDVQSFMIPNWAFRLYPRQWPLMTVALFERYPQFFREVLNRAQVVEANHLLDPDPAGTLSRMGVFSKKTGEDSIMFKNGVRPAKYGIARETMEVLKGYLDNRYIITRS